MGVVLIGKGGSARSISDCIRMATFGSVKVCDGCGADFHRFFRKVCVECSGSLCNSCFRKEDKDSSTCRLCTLTREYSLKRRDLEKMAVPITDKNSLVEVILINQAKKLTERALNAQRQLVNPTALGDLNFVSTTQPGPDKSHFDPSSVGNLSDLASEDQICMLPVKQLKTILQRNCIDYRGCVEKDELRERVIRLWQARQKEKELEQKINSTGDEVAEQDFLCKICMDSPVDCVLLECGHMLTCVRCGRQLNECPICRQFVTRVVHAFKV